MEAEKPFPTIALEEKASGGQDAVAPQHPVQLRKPGVSWGLSVLEGNGPVYLTLGQIPGRRERLEAEGTHDIGAQASHLEILR